MTVSLTEDVPVCDFERELDEPGLPQPEWVLSNEDLKQITALFGEALEEALGEYVIKSPPNTTALRVYRYRERLRAAHGNHTLEQWLARVSYYGWRCRYCGDELLPQTLVKEHAMPLSRGGTNWASNLVPSCKPCNSSKRDQTLSEFQARRAT